MKKITLVLILLVIYILPVFSFSDESKADLRRAADWWETRAGKLNVRLGELERENPDPSNPDDKTWQEYLKVLDEIKTAEAKQQLYRETARFDYTRSLIKETVQVYRPAADFMEFTLGRGVELVNALISQSWQDLVKISVDSVLRTRIRAKIRSGLGCSKTVPGLENWLVVMGFGEDPWGTTVDQAVLNWAKGDAQGKAMLLSFQAEKGRQIYRDYLKKPQLVSAAANAKGNPLQWLEDKSKVTGEKVMDVLGLATFVSDIGGRLWISFEMDDSLNDTLENLKALRKKYKENNIDLSCEDLFLVWSKQKTIEIEDPEEKARLEKLKTGLDFFVKKIPAWYKNKTVPNHFKEIVRMIPVAEELGEYDTAENLRDILIEFEYKEMTPEEITASEKQSLIEETRGYLISSMKVLRNFLQKKYYTDADSERESVKTKWNELENLGYNIDNDREIQNLWSEIRKLDNGISGQSDTEDNSEGNTGQAFALIEAEEKTFESYLQSGNFNKAKMSNSKMQYMLTPITDKLYNGTLPEGDEKRLRSLSDAIKFALREKDMDSSDLDSYNSLIDNPFYPEYKKTILMYFNKRINAKKQGNDTELYKVMTQQEEYESEVSKYGIDPDDIYKDTDFYNRIEDLQDQLYNMKDPEDNSDTSGKEDWYRNDKAPTENSSF